MKVRCQTNRKCQKISAGGIILFTSCNNVEMARVCFSCKFLKFCVFFSETPSKMALNRKMKSWDGVHIKARHLSFQESIKPVFRSYLKWRTGQKYQRRWKSWKNSKKCQNKKPQPQKSQNQKTKNMESWPVTITKAPWRVFSFKLYQKSVAFFWHQILYRSHSKKVTRAGC